MSNIFNFYFEILKNRVSIRLYPLKARYAMPVKNDNFVSEPLTLSQTLEQLHHLADGIEAQDVYDENGKLSQIKYADKLEEKEASQLVAVGEQRIKSGTVDILRDKDGNTHLTERRVSHIRGKQVNLLGISRQFDNKFGDEIVVERQSEFDAQGRCLSVQENGKLTEFVRNQKGRLEYIVNDGRVSAALEYDENDRLTKYEKIKEADPTKAGSDLYRETTSVSYNADGSYVSNTVYSTNEEFTHQISRQCSADHQVEAEIYRGQNGEYTERQYLSEQKDYMTFAYSGNGKKLQSICMGNNVLVGSFKHEKEDYLKVAAGFANCTTTEELDNAVLALQSKEVKKQETAQMVEVQLKETRANLLKKKALQPVKAAKTAVKKAKTAASQKIQEEYIKWTGIDISYH